MDGNHATFGYTNDSVNGSWTAKFTLGEFEVTKVKIRNRTGSDAGRLTGAIIRIDGTQCGTVPSLALGIEATVTCSASIVGKSVKVETVTNEALSFSDLQVWGYGCTTYLYKRNAAGTDWTPWPTSLAV